VGDRDGDDRLRVSVTPRGEEGGGDTFSSGDDNGELDSIVSRERSVSVLRCIG
jgi:hypothetical protein